jgi:hypothetical protein
MATYIPKLKWAWQAQFLSHTLLILKINTTFKGLQIMLLLLFDFFTGFRFSKISVECTLHSEAPPCFIIPCLQGQPLGFDTKYLALADGNMQV